MKKYIALLILFLISAVNLKAQVSLTGETSGYFPQEELDAVRNRSIYYFSSNKQHIEFCKTLLSLYSDGLKNNYPPNTIVILKYYFCIDEKGKAVMIKPVSDYPHVNSQLNPKEMTGKIIETIGSYTFIIGAINKKPVKYSFMFELTIDPENARHNEAVMKESARISTGNPMKLEEYATSGFIKPEVISMEKPAYPTIARLAGIEGTVLIKAYINEKGIVKYAEIARSIGQDCGIDEEALRVVKSAKFTPARFGTGPGKAQITVPVIFDLEDNN